MMKNNDALAFLCPYCNLKEL